MNRKSSSRQHPHPSNYESLDQSQDGENVEMQSIQSQTLEILISSNNEPSIPSGRPMRLGITVLLAIATSSAVLITAVVFLTWLWFEDKNAELWRRLILSGRATQTITLMSVLIRWAIGTLAVISTSMAASIALEVHGVPMSALAEVSIARFTNSGPRSFKKLLPGTTFRSWLRILMICQFLLVLASQFASTLLVNDLQDINIISPSKNMTYGCGFEDPTDQMLMQIDTDYWARTPSQSEIFAEYAESRKSSDDVDETGLVLRAFLPIASQAQRESIQSFNGIARIIDASVVCVQPTFNARYCQDPDDSETWFIHANVTASLSNLPPYYIFNETTLRYEIPRKNETFYSSFKCELPGNMIDNPLETWLLCLGTTARVALISPLTDLNPFIGNHLGKRHTSRLLIDISKIDYEGLFLKETTLNATWEHLNSSTAGPWVRQWSRIEMRKAGQTREEHISMTLCFVPQLTSEIEHLPITASTTSNLTEPSYSYPRDSYRYDTSLIRRQLAAIDFEAEDRVDQRQVLKISTSILRRRLKEDSWNTSLDNSWGSWPSGVEGTYDIVICGSCGAARGRGLRAVSPLVGQIFNDMINSTGSPALAVQALFTMILRIAYYEHMSSYYQMPDPATITTFDLFQAPNQKLGFSILMAIIMGNITVFLVMAFFFLSYTKSSFIENAWHTVAQISQSDDAQPILEKVVLAPDQDVDRLIRGGEPPMGLVESVRDFFNCIRRMFDQREMKEERLVLRNGVFNGINSQ